MSDKSTKERILNAAEKLMLENSFHSVGLTQILNEVNVPKGSFYHHFSSKEELGTELLKNYSSNLLSHSRQILLNQDIEDEPIARLLSFFEGIIASFQANAGNCPCLVIKLASELAGYSDDMRNVLSHCFDDLGILYEQVLEEAIGKKLLPADFDCKKHAQLIQDVWYGAMQRAIANKSIKPLRNAVTCYKDFLISPLSV